MTNQEKNEKNNIIVGRNAVRETILSGKQIDQIIVSNGEKKGSIVSIINLAKQNKIVVKSVAPQKLNTISGDLNHQGIIAFVNSYHYSTVDEIINYANEKNQSPFIIIADSIEDPHNLGAIIRSAECAGAHGVIIPQRRSAGLNASVAKSAAGAIEHIKVAKVANLCNTIDELKKKGLWIYCADAKGTLWTNSNLTGPIGLIIGSEGFGVHRLVKEKCDGILSLPLLGKINSLNASVAAGILMYEAVRQRNLSL